jgi:hypothetical protein
MTNMNHSDPRRTSVITSKPAICYHFKTRQRNHPQHQKDVYRSFEAEIVVKFDPPKTRTSELSGVTTPFAPSATLRAGFMIPPEVRGVQDA